MKVLTVIGTRPEAIKMALLIKELNKCPNIDHKLCITSQHKEMLQQVLVFFKIEVDYDFDLMKKGQDLTDVTCRVLLSFRDLFKNYKPDYVLVHGDTTTCMAASMAAFYAGIKVGHIEAGLRTGNIRSPFPEEANRLIVGRLADVHFAPTKNNQQNLLNEGITGEKIVVTGNTVIDSLLYTSSKVKKFSRKVTDKKLQSIYNQDDKIVLITGHRRENFGEGFIEICEAIAALAKEFSKVNFVYPVHLNPNVQKPVNDYLAGIKNICLTDPLDYPDFVYAMKHSYIILTDSGGVQEEAPSLGKPVLVMRDTTERPEAVEAGTVLLVGARKESIVKNVRKLLISEQEYKTMSRAYNPYGDGDAVHRIIKKMTNIN